MDHIPVGEIASQLPMFIDPTTIVDTCWPASGTPPTPWATAPMSVTPRAYGNANTTVLLMAAFTEGDRALGYWGAVGSAGALVGQLLVGKKNFAWFVVDEHGDGRIGLGVRAAPSTRHTISRTSRHGWVC